MATYTPNPKEMKERLEKKEKKLTARIAEQDKFLNDIQSSAFSLANYYFVFQGVILTIVCNGAQNLKPSNRWFLLTLSILAVLVNLFALIQIGIKYIDTKASQEIFNFRAQ
jgi:translation initiation factor 2B subunit (eIF-2B alpha/beta/delta family)